LVTKRLQLACHKRDKRAVGNLQFLKAEVRELLSVWPERLRLERVFILYPDPWPKKRHIKNRIIQTQLLDQLAQITLPGAYLHFRTDHEGHFAWAVEIISAHSAWKVVPAAAWPFENPSYFQELFGIHESLTAMRL
ncbi:MAG TPA: hypothetical protein VK995_02395, partial [Oceanipulchritudo sp.]|nr:hypothetical protein [Oceanipulchritudo sp.]